MTEAHKLLRIAAAVALQDAQSSARRATAVAMLSRRSGQTNREGWSGSERRPLRWVVSGRRRASWAVGGVYVGALINAVHGLPDSARIAARAAPRARGPCCH